MALGADRTPTQTRVLSIVGPGRSGTTILGNILGEVAGITNAGELRWLWRRGLIERRPCGCGLPPVECPVWSAVLRHLDSDYIPSTAERNLPADLELLLESQKEVLARRNRLRAITTAAHDIRWEALRRMRAATAEVCASLAEITGAGLVVDTSKRPEVAALLAGSDSFEHYVLHVVRDPRAVAFSMQRPKPLPLATGLATMATQGVLGSAGTWMELCLGAELLRRRVARSRWMFLRYEEFVADPRGTVEWILEHVGFSGGGPFVSADTVALGTNHTLAGNPNRFRTGLVTITEDDEWRARMSARDRAVASALTLPLLLRYGYPVRLDGRSGGRGPVRGLQDRRSRSRGGTDAT